MSHEYAECTHAVLVGNVVALLFIYIVSIPMITYYTYRFYQHKSNPIMKHRDVIFVISLNCLIIFGFVTYTTVTILHHIGALELPLFLRGLLAGITVWGTMNLLCIKSYLLYFQHQYHLSIQNASWKQFIDSSWNDWYLRNKNKWGQFSYVIRWISIPYVLSIIMETLGSAVLGWLGSSIFHMIVVFVPIILIIAFSFRLRNFYDIYGIRKEIISQWLAFLICGVVYFIASYVLKGIYTEDAEHLTLMLSVFGTWVIVASFTFVGISSVYYPLCLVHHQATQQLQETTGTIKRLSLYSVIRDPKMLSLLMQHSVTEFNTENLLFIIETVQIKHAYSTAKNNVIQTSNKHSFVPDELKESNTPTLVIDFNDFVLPKKDPAAVETELKTSCPSNGVASCITTYLIGSGCVKLEISSELPTSDVLTNDPEDIKAQMTSLYHKYVESGSCFEVNIPFELKQNVLSFITKEKSEEVVEGDWFWVMDETCLHIMAHLLTGMVHRYQKTEPFQRYVKSKEYQTSIKDVELINVANKPGVYDGVLYDQIVQKYENDV
eukprot:102209_1